MLIYYLQAIARSLKFTNNQLRLQLQTVSPVERIISGWDAHLLHLDLDLLYIWIFAVDVFTMWSLVMLGTVRRQEESVGYR